MGESSMTKDGVAVDVTLVLVRKDGRTLDVKLKKERTVLGRQTECDIRVPVGAVSRQHCEFRLEGDGSVKVRDLGSSNGTFVNAERTDEATLEAGDIVSVGPVRLVARIDGVPASVDPRDIWSRGGADEAVSAGKGGPRLAQDPAPRGEPAAGPIGAPPPLIGGGSDESSVSDFDFDFLDDEDDDQPEL